MFLKSLITSFIFNQKIKVTNVHFTIQSLLKQKKNTDFIKVNKKMFL